MSITAERAVKRTTHILRYHLNRGQLESAVMGWAVIALANAKKPDLLPGPLTWKYLSTNKTKPGMLDISWFASFSFDQRMKVDTPVAAHIVHSRKFADKLIDIWRNVETDGDLLGDAYMALLAD